MKLCANGLSIKTYLKLRNGVVEVGGRDRDLLVAQQIGTIGAFLRRLNSTCASARFECSCGPQQDPTGANDLAGRRMVI